MNVIRQLPYLDKKPDFNFLPLNASQGRHLNLDGQDVGKTLESQADFGEFGNLVMNALNNTNDLQMESDLLQQQMLVSPDSVKIHEVTTAIAQADMALNLTKAVVDRAVQAYREITTMR